MIPHALPLLALLFLAASPRMAEAAKNARSTRLEAAVTDHKGDPVKDAVVFVYEMEGSRVEPNAAPRIMDQVDIQFAPRLLPILAGEKVHFPNKDDIHHHIYSFSKPKKFEIPLHKGKASAPVVFDKPGIVKVGCNIHDWMRGVILVLPTPYFAMTDTEGNAELELPREGSLELAVFHRRLRGKLEKTRKTVKLDGPRAEASWQIKLKKRRARSKRPKTVYQ